MGIHRHGFYGSVEQVVKHHRKITSKKDQNSIICFIKLCSHYVTPPPCLVHTHDSNTLLCVRDSPKNDTVPYPLSPWRFRGAHMQVAGKEQQAGLQSIKNLSKQSQKGGPSEDRHEKSLQTQKKRKRKRFFVLRVFFAMQPPRNYFEGKKYLARKHFPSLIS